LGASIFGSFIDAARWLVHFWINQIGGTFLAPGSTMGAGGLVLTTLIAAYLAVPRERRVMPRLRVWRRALFPRRLWRSASGRADLGWFAFGLLGYGIFFGWAVLSSHAVAGALTSALDRLVGPAHPLALPAAITAPLLTIAFFLAYDFAYWLDHYLSHKLAWLWQFHRVHHGADSLSLLTNFRVHPVDTIVFAGTTAMILGSVEALAVRLLGAAQPITLGGTNAIVMLSAITITHLQHSHLWISFGPRWGRWLLGAAHHQIHHSVDPRHHDRNFGNVLTLWDRLFGTFHMPAIRREPITFGLGADEAAPHGWHAAIVAPVAGAARMILPQVLPHQPLPR